MALLYNVQKCIKICIQSVPKHVVLICSQLYALYSLNPFPLK